MNDASTWRLDIAQRIAPFYAANPHVTTIIVGGSSARGHADQFSDIEIGVFWHQPPTDDERRSVVEHVGADLVRLYPYEADEEVWSDDYMIGRANPNSSRSGVLVEVGHYTSDTMERVLDDVLLRFDTDVTKHNLLAGLRDGIALHNIQLIQTWQQRVAHYPDDLVVAVINRYAVIDHFWRWKMWLQRGDNLMMLYNSFAQTQQNVLHLLLALNRVYYFGWKWLDIVVERLPIAPSDLAQRLKRVYQIEPAAAAQQLALLVEETYDLVEQHAPQIDVAWLRSVFRYHRPVWEQPPPFEQFTSRVNPL